MSPSRPVIIYYLDDEPELCTIFQEIYQSETTRIETFTDPEDLIARCRKQKPDGVVLDNRLSGQLGEDVARKIDASIPKILVSGDLQMPPNPLFISILEKPLREQEILAFISSLRSIRTR